MAGGDRCACQVALLERVRHRDVVRCVVPTSEARDEDVCRARTRPAGDEALGLPGRRQRRRHRRVVQLVPEAGVPGDTFALAAAAETVVSEPVAVPAAGHALKY